VLWDKIIVTFIGQDEHRNIDAGNKLKNILMKNDETDYIARVRGRSLDLVSLSWIGRVAEGIGLPYR
ncbi:hypothetical protein TNCV_112351, partial [Trichonephila clavipes]